jgi:hypothetical protein
MTMALQSVRLKPLHAGLILIVAVSPLIAGCAKGSSSSVHGKVTLDGEPVAAGDIVFLPTQSSARKAAAAIEQGTYALAASDRLSPGSYRVEIRWPKTTGRKIASADPGMQTEETREAIPAKYNSDSTLKVDVGSGDVEQDFALTSK